MSNLHQFHLHLCDYTRSNAAAHLANRYVGNRAHLLASGLLPYLLGETGDEAGEPRPNALLLNDEELFELEHLYRELSGVCGFEWSPCPELHRLAILCVREIRERLNPTEADAWSRAADAFAAELEQPHLSLEDGIRVIGEWTGTIQRYLIAMDLTQFLPAPDGTAPTPTHPTSTAFHSGSRGEAGAEIETMISTDQAVGSVGVAVVADDRVARLEALFAELQDRVTNAVPQKEWYTVLEVAQITTYAKWTIRQACNTGRIPDGSKKKGDDGKWRISHEGLCRIQNEGLPAE